MVKYHLRKVFKPEEKEVLLQAIQGGFWKNPEKRLTKIRELAVKLSVVNNIKPPTVICVSTATPGYEAVANVNIIILNKPSLVSFLHQFVFHKFNGYVPPAFFEDYARAYSLGLFYSCDPKNFKKAAKSGQLVYIEPGEVK